MVAANEILTISGQSDPACDASGSMTDDGATLKFKFDASEIEGQIP